MTPFHKFLLKHRIYCERCSIMTLTLATDVIRENGHDIAVCDLHAEQPTKTKIQPN